MGLKADMSAMGRGAKREPGARLRRRRQPSGLLEHDLGCGRRALQVTAAQGSRRAAGHGTAGRACVALACVGLVTVVWRRCGGGAAPDSTDGAHIPAPAATSHLTTPGNAGLCRGAKSSWSRQWWPQW